MQLPALFFGFILSTLYGAGFHLLLDGGLGRLILFLLAAWSGFGAGQYLADRLEWVFFSLGPLHLGMATLGSIIFLVGSYWLSLVDTEKK
ncbi:MAG: hypothetical protein MUO64_22995 [Anaerolineales bacterium]|jgi:hypothetical protein|nr:hypothetical protein [Anaerolineales bacterium]